MKTTITITILVFSILAFNITKLSAQNEILGHTYMGTFEGHAYYLSNCYTTWEQANDAAMQMGGYLSSITSEEEDNFIKSFAPVVTFSYGGDGEILYGAWIGLVQQNGTWTWSNGEDLDYTNWGFNDDIALQEPIQCCYGLTGRVTSAGDFNFWFTSGLYSFYGNRQYIVEFENDPGCNNPNKSYVCHNGNTICVNNDAVQAHLNHGDYAGPCGPCNSNSLTIFSEDITPDEDHSLIHQVSIDDFTNDQKLFRDRVSGQEFKIFPNPTPGLTKIQLPQPVKTGTLIIRSITGRKISTIPLQQTNHHQLDLSNLINGLYLIELQSQNNLWQNIIVKI